MTTKCTAVNFVLLIVRPGLGQQIKDLPIQVLAGYKKGQSPRNGDCPFYSEQVGIILLS